MKKWVALSALVCLAAGITFTLYKAKAALGPGAKPDLIVDQKRLLQNWIVRVENLPAGFVAAAGEPCPNKDPNGFCHQLPELNYDNNVSEIQITIPDHPGKQGVGPLKNQPQLTAEPID